MTKHERGLSEEERAPAEQNRDETEVEGVANEVEQVVEEIEDLESLKKALAKEKDKAENYLANWQRAQADLINYKKRTEQEQAELSKFANAALILNLLPIIDDLERALSSIPANLQGLTWIDGVGLIYRKLRAILEAHGLSEIKAIDAPFDPRLHEAIMHKEGEEGKVVEEVQKGYKLHDRVIRPTMVIVGNGKEEKEQPQQEE